MSAKLLHGQQLFASLKTAGFPVPDECRSAEIHMGVDEVLMIRFDCYITRDQLPIIAKAFADLAKNMAIFDAEPQQDTSDEVRN